MIPINPLSLIPATLKQQILDQAIDFVSQTAQQVLGEQAGIKLESLKSDASFQTAFTHGIRRATEKFAIEYVEEDEDLVHAILQNEDFWQSRSVKHALSEMMKHPTKWSDENRQVIIEHFDDALPNRRNRDRVDKAITFFLQCLVEEVWHLNELKPVYELQLQKISVEKATEMVYELRNMRNDIRQVMVSLVKAIANDNKLIDVKSAHLPDSINGRILHNLPQPDYEEFIGRSDELSLLSRILHPDHRMWCVVIDGIGGVGKSALALEIARQYLPKNESELEKFDAVIWTSAKTESLTADGIQPRQQSTRTIEDLFKTIASTLELDEIIRASLDDQFRLIQRALTHRRVLLIIDNLETVDDHRVNSFIRELPEPTKCIVTTRHRIDVAYPIRLTGLPRSDALSLISHESKRRNVILDDQQTATLFNRTAGVPLALVWSISLMSYGHSVEGVLRRLGHPNSDITRYCFEGAVEQIKNKAAFLLLLAIVLAERIDRKMVGVVTNVPELDRDEGLADLERLSLINKDKSTFSVLPLVSEYVLQGLGSIAPDAREGILLRVTELTVSSRAFVRVRNHVEVSKETQDKITEIIDTQFGYAIQSYDDQSVYYYLFDLEAIGSESAIASLIWMAQTGYHFPTDLEQDWASAEALKSLIRLEQIEYLMQLVNNDKSLLSPQYICNMVGEHGTKETAESLKRILESHALSEAKHKLLQDAVDKIYSRVDKQ